jgi:hypothetical protein
VVKAAGALGRAGVMPSVPTLAAFSPSAAQISRAKLATEVLPLVPVTAAMWCGCSL